jgi:predicted RNase H-like HicB family nuclease
MTMPMTKIYEISVQVLITQEDDCFVAYCPALELSSYADTETEAKKSFEEALSIFLTETERKGTLEKVLLGLGWTLRQKPSFQYQPPVLSKTDRSLIQSKRAKVLEEKVPIRSGFAQRTLNYASPH